MDRDGPRADAAVMPTRTLLALFALTGCYTTRVGRETDGPYYEHRQWFTLAGLAQLSDPAGQECAVRYQCR